MNANKLENWEILNSMQSIHGIWFSLLGIPRETCRHPHSNFEEHWSLRFQLLLKTGPLGERPPMRHCFKKRISTLGQEKGLKAGPPRNMALHDEALFCETTHYYRMDLLSRAVTAFSPSYRAGTTIPGLKVPPLVPGHRAGTKGSTGTKGPPAEQTWPHPLVPVGNPNRD